MSEMQANSSVAAPEYAGSPVIRQGWKRSLRPLIDNPLTIAGGVLILVMVALAFSANLVAPYDPLDIAVSGALKGPSLAHWFGTDRFGRDVFSRVIYGSRISLWVGFTSVAAATVIGTLVGLVSGYFGGWLDHLSGRVMDVIFSFPSLLLAIAIAAVLGPGVNNAIIAIVIVYAPLFSRVARASVLAERGKDYIDAARVAGGGHARILRLHILPNILSPLIVQVAISISQAILVESYLSFLGLGTQPPSPSWGTMLNEGKNYLESAPWASVFPGLAIMAAVLGFNLLGDGLRDILDPRSH